MRANRSVRRRLHIDVACNERSPLSGLLRVHGDVSAPLNAVVVPEASTRAVGRMIPASPSAPIRTNEIWLPDLGLVAADQLSVFINALHPGDRVDIRPRIDELASFPIEHPDNPALVRMHKKLLRVAIPGDVYQH